MGIDMGKHCEGMMTAVPIVVFLIFCGGGRACKTIPSESRDQALGEWNCEMVNWIDKI